MKGNIRHFYYYHEVFFFIPWTKLLLMYDTVLTHTQPSLLKVTWVVLFSATGMQDKPLPFLKIVFFTLCEIISKRAHMKAIVIELTKWSNIATGFIGFYCFGVGSFHAEVVFCAVNVSIKGINDSKVSNTVL